MVTMAVAVRDLAGHVSPEFPGLLKEYGRELGLRKLARELRGSAGTLAIAPVKPRRNGHRRRKKLWWTEDPGPEGRRRQMEYDAKRHTFNVPWPFTWARREYKAVLDESAERLALYEPRECCGESMGVMESWIDGDGGPVRAVYQCAVSPKHQEPAEIRSGE